MKYMQAIRDWRLRRAWDRAYRKIGHSRESADAVIADFESINRTLFDPTDTYHVRKVTGMGEKQAGIEALKTALQWIEDNAHRMTEKELAAAKAEYERHFVTIRALVNS